MTALDNPAAMDELVYAFPETRLGHSSDLERVRAAHLALVRSDPAEMRAALLDLATLTAPPARGIALMLRLMLGDEEAVAEETLAPRGSSPLEWEDVCHQAAAIGVACVQTGRLDRAQMHLMVARTLAEGLGLRHRQQNLTLEWARIGALRGQPEPEVIQAELLRPMPDRRRAWGERTLAESLMGLGCYESALQALGTPETDTPPDRGLREFLHAMLSLPAPVTLEPADPYSRLAGAMRQLAAGRAPGNLDGITGFPEQGYAALIEAVALVRAPGMAQQAVRVLGRQQYGPADQAFYRLSTLMGAVAEGATLHGAAFLGRETPLLEQLATQLARLRSPGEVMALQRRLIPRRFALLAFSPSPAFHGVGLSTLPLLAGKHVLLGREAVPMPGRAGPTLVLEALGVPHVDLRREERARYRRAIEGLSEEPVNLGWIVRACLRLEENARRLGHPNEAAGWRQSAAQVVELLTPDVREALATYPPHL